MWWENEFRRQKTRGSICCAIFLVCFLTMASSAGLDFMNSEVAGSILTVFFRTKKRKEKDVMFKNP